MKQDIINLRSQSLDLLRFPLALIIVAIHLFDSAGFNFRDIHIDLNDYESLSFIKYIKASFFKSQSVPIYFFISGYVFFLGGKMTRERFLKKFSNRAKSLLIPYLSWNSLALIMMLLTFSPILKGITSNLNNFDLNFSLSAFLYTFWDAGKGVIQGMNNSVPQDFSMWFVRDLIVIVITTPILYLCIKKYQFKFLTIMSFLWVCAWFYDDYMIDQFMTGFFFFTWGATYSILGIDMVNSFKSLRGISFIIYPLISITLLIVLIYDPQYYRFFKLINIIAGLFFAFNLSIILLEKKVFKVNKFLAASSFFIYAAHPLVVTSVQKVIFIIISPHSEATVLLGYLMSFISIIILLLIAFYICNSSKLLSRLLIGRQYKNSKECNNMILENIVVKVDLQK